MSEPQNQQFDILIIGTGLAGLACARRLQVAGRSFLICEAADRVVGRVATGVCDGYRLDRGFQVLLTAYPEARSLRDYEALDLHRFYPGALVRHGGKWHRLADPFRHPIDGLRGAFNPIGSPKDKLRVDWLRFGGFDFSRHATESTSLDALRAKGFSESMIEPTLLLNGEGRGPVKHLTVLSAMSPDYAPSGRHLISVSVVDQAAAAAQDLEERVRKQLVDWFGTRVNHWRLLRVDRIPDAVPGWRVAEEKPARVRQGVYQCGDHCGIASIDTALSSGTAAAEAVLEESPP